MKVMGATWAVLLTSVALGTSLPAAADVIESGANGFVVQQAALISVPSSRAWDALTVPSQWWDPAHTWSGDSRELTIEPIAGGCFCEALPGGGSVEHMRVIQSSPGKLLRMTGALGPLQGEALTGTLTVELEPEAQGTRIRWTYVVGGHARFPLAKVAAGVDAVLSDQLARLEVLIRRNEGRSADF